MADKPLVERIDVLNGYEEIAAALGITVRQAKHRAGIGAFPIIRQGRRVMARRSSIERHFAKLEKEA